MFEVYRDKVLLMQSDEQDGGYADSILQSMREAGYILKGMTRSDKLIKNKIKRSEYTRDDIEQLSL